MSSVNPKIVSSQSPVAKAASVGSAAPVVSPQSSLEAGKGSVDTFGPTVAAPAYSEPSVVASSVVSGDMPFSQDEVKPNESNSVIESKEEVNTSNSKKLSVSDKFDHDFRFDSSFRHFLPGGSYKDYKAGTLVKALTMNWGRVMEIGRRGANCTVLDKKTGLDEIKLSNLVKIFDSN